MTALAVIGGIVGALAIVAAVFWLAWRWIVKSSPDGNPFL